MEYLCSELLASTKTDLISSRQIWPKKSVMPGKLLPVLQWKKKYELYWRPAQERHGWAEWRIFGQR
jgi:hypothetical protein